MRFGFMITDIHYLLLDEERLTVEKRIHYELLQQTIYNELLTPPHHTSDGSIIFLPHTPLKR